MNKNKQLVNNMFKNAFYVIPVPINLPEYSHDLAKNLNTPMKNNWAYDFSPDTLNSSPITDPKLKERLAILHKARARSAIAGIVLGGTLGAFTGSQVFDGFGPAELGIGGILGGGLGGLAGGVLGQRTGIKQFNEHLKAHGKGVQRPASQKEIGDTENSNRAMEYAGTGATLGSLLGVGAKFMDKGENIPRGLPTGLIGAGLGGLLAYALAKGTEKKAEEQANQLMQGSFMDRFKSELNNPQPSSNFAADSIQAAIRRETMRDVANISGQQPSPSLAMSSIAAPYVEPDIDVCGGGACNNPVEANVGPATMASIKPAVAVAPTSKSKGMASFFQNFKKKTDVGIPLVGKASPRASFGKNNVRLGFNKQF